MTNPELTIGEWVRVAPLTIRQALDSVPLLNALRDHRNHLFQMSGAYDGAMSEGCKKLTLEHYQAIDEFLAAIVAARASCTPKKDSGVSDENETWRYFN